MRGARRLQSHLPPLTIPLYVFPISALLPVQPHPQPSPSPCGWIDPQAEAWFSFSVHSVCSVGRHLRLPLRQTSNTPSPTQTKIIIPPMILPPLHLFRPTSSSAFSKSQRCKLSLRAHAPAHQCPVSASKSPSPTSANQQHSKSDPDQNHFTPNDFTSSPPLSTNLILYVLQISAVQDRPSGSCSCSTV
jgi:hypothetical protein